MTAESNVGARLFLIGKNGVLTGLKEIQAATARLNAEIAAGAKSSKVAAAGYEEQAVGLEALGVKMDLYQKNLARASLETDALARVGKVAFLGLTAATAAWTYESVKWAQQYQTQLVQLRTQAGLTVGAMNAIGDAAKRNAANLGVSPTAYLQAAYHPASTGMSTAQTIAITNYAAKEAAISGAPLEDTTNSLTGVMKAMGFGKGQTGNTIALLNAIVGAGNMHFSDLNSALGSGVASTAKTFGVSLTSLGGALAYQTDRGVPAAQAGTRLRMAMSLLGAPSVQATKFLTDAGLSQTEAKDRTNAMSQTLIAAGLSTTQLSSALRNNSGAGGIYNALDLLHKGLAGSGMSKELQAAFISRSFGGGRMGTTIESLYNNLPGLAQKSEQIAGGGTKAKFNQDWIDTTKTLDFQMHKLEGTVETLGTTFGLAIIPPLTKVVGLFTDLLSMLGKNKALAIGLGTAVTAVLVPAMGVYLYRALLSSGGAIRSVIGGYARLLGAQSAEDVALARTDAAFVGNDAALSVNDRALLANAADRAGGGLGGGLGGALGKTALGLGGAYLGGSLIRGNSGSAINSKQSATRNVRSLLGDVGEGAIAGATLGSVVPVIGTALGGLLGAGGGALVAGRHQIGSALHTGWDDLFGEGGSSSNTTKIPRGVITSNVNVYLDGKQLRDAVVKQNKQQAARN